VARREGDLAEALGRYREAMSGVREAGSRGVVHQCLFRCAGIAAARGDGARAARLFGADEAWRARMGIPLRRDWRAQYEDDVASARAAVGDSAFAAAWAEGRELTLEQAVAYALEDPPAAT
jgi:hypothetical protein